MKNLNRRQFAFLSTSSIGLAMNPSIALGLSPQSGTPPQGTTDAPEPHYFLKIFFPGGMDCLYTFDARPMEMTQAGLLVNHMDEEPEVLTDTNGNKALVTRLVKPLRPHLDRFSVLNGVIMVPGFDGHTNNVDYLLSGNAFGGESLLPHFNEVGQRSPLDFVTVGGLMFSNVTNASNSIPLTPKSAESLNQRMAAFSTFDLKAPSLNFAHQRMMAHGKGTGKFSAGSRAMAAGFEKVPTLVDSVKSLKVTDSGTDEITKMAQLIGKIFTGNLSKSVQLVIDQSVIPNLQLDTHDAQSAKDSPRMIGQAMEALAQMISYLRNTAFDGQKSLLDVTTVLVGTEFGRTMRSEYIKEISESGTDHNSLKNTFLLGGKGIKGGLVVGGTDHQTSGEKISEAHKGLDPHSLKAMGRPLNFATLAPAQELPSEFRPTDYLDCSCLANTLYHLYGVPTNRYRILGRNGPQAKILDGLLA